MKRRVTVSKDRAQRFVITLSMKPSIRRKKASQRSLAFTQALLPRWEEKRFEVAIVSKAR
jgi:hypothetical protein